MKIATKRFLKRFSILFLAGVLLITTSLVYANWIIPKESEPFLYDNPENIPNEFAALVLGSSQKTASGLENPYFTYRIQAAKELYLAGKVKCFVVSGDNGRQSYNEPEDMRQALIQQGIPDSVIYMDFAGFRTLDSVVRMYKIFGQKSFIIVSQQFHNERAVYLARHYGLDAYGYNSKDLKMSRFSFLTKLREKLARLKVLIDITTGKEPKFLGTPIELKS